jgi:Ni/Co efflux regulator RcnB
MKRILLTGLSALTLAGSFGATASAQDFNRRGDWNNDSNRGGDWNNDSNRRGDWNNDNDRRGDWNNDNDRRGDHGRDRYRRGRYDQFNRSWRRGDRLPYGYENRFRGVDYRYAHLRQPPYGYRYVRDDRGQVLLVGIATGVILSAILSNY